VLSSRAQPPGTTGLCPSSASQDLVSLAQGGDPSSAVGLASPTPPSHGMPQQCLCHLPPALTPSTLHSSCRDTTPDGLLESLGVKGNPLSLPWGCSPWIWRAYWGMLLAQGSLVSLPRNCPAGTLTTPALSRQPLLQAARAVGNYRPRQQC